MSFKELFFLPLLPLIAAKSQKRQRHSAGKAGEPPPPIQIAPPEKRETENGKSTEKENEVKQKEQPFSGNRREPTRVKQQWGKF